MARYSGIRANKAGRIEINYQVHGKRHYETLELNDNPTNRRTAAKIREQRIAHAKDEGHLRTDNPTVWEVAKLHLDALEADGKSPEHVRNVQLDLERRWLPYIQDLKIRSVRVRHLREADRGIEWSSPKRQQNSQSIIRQLFAFAEDEEYIDENPAKKLKAAKHQRPKIDPFNEREREAILKALEPEAGRYFTVALETGLRTAELLGLDWQDIRDGKLHIRQTMVNGNLRSTTKTKQEREVFLSPIARSALSPDLRPTSGLVFQETRKWYWLRWREALEAAGVRYRTPYNCRHTRASVGLSAGQTPAWLATQMGHDIRTFFEYYATFMKGDTDEQEMAKLEATSW